MINSILLHPMLKKKNPSPLTSDHDTVLFEMFQFSLFPLRIKSKAVHIASKAAFARAISTSTATWTFFHFLQQTTIFLLQTLCTCCSLMWNAFTFSLPGNQLTPQVSTCHFLRKTSQSKSGSLDYSHSSHPLLFFQSHDPGNIQSWMWILL